LVCFTLEGMRICAAYNVDCRLGSTSDAEMLQRMQSMEQTHRVAVQQMVMSHSNELEKLEKFTSSLQPQMKPVSNCC